VGGGDLATNFHPLERRITSRLGVLLIIAVALFTSFPGAVTGALFGGAVIVCVAGAVYLQVTTRNWQRYKRYASEP
jgi:Na+/H+-translocating membrane pyrophosphatase